MELALLFFWIWIAITVIVDIFRGHDLSGVAKAGWLLRIVIVPLIGVLIYLIARGGEMHERAARAASEQDAAVRSYIRQRRPRRHAALLPGSVRSHTPLNGSS